MRKEDVEFIGEAITAIFLVGFVPVCWCILGVMGAL